MYFIGIIGDPGSGKSSMMTAILHDAYKSGQKVIANYHLEFPYNLMSFNQIRKLGPEIQDAIIGLDELGEGADSYEFFAEGPKAISKLVRQVRKRNAKIYYNVQRFSLIAARLRRQTQMFILMEDRDRFKPGHTKNNCNSLFSYEVVGIDYQIIRKGIFNGKPIQHLYNTNEIIWGYDDEDEEIPTKKNHNKPDYKSRLESLVQDL